MSDHVAVTDPASEQEAIQRLKGIASRQAAAASRRQNERQAAEAAELQARLNAVAERVRELSALATPAEVQARDPRRIMSEVARQFGVTLRDITGHSREAHGMRARLAAIHAVRLAHPEMSVKRLGRNFGNRDHTSILCAIRKMEREGVPQPPVLSQGEAAR